MVRLYFANILFRALGIKYVYVFSWNSPKLVSFELDLECPLWFLFRVESKMDFGVLTHYYPPRVNNVPPANVKLELNFSFFKMVIKIILNGIKFNLSE